MSHKLMTAVKVNTDKLAKTKGLSESHLDKMMICDAALQLINGLSLKIKCPCICVSLDTNLCLIASVLEEIK